MPASCASRVVTCSFSGNAETKQMLDAARVVEGAIVDKL
jgi:hypothetical protein